MSKFYKKCVVRGCPNNEIGDKSVGVVRFFGVPVSPDNRYPSDSIIIQQRRELWLARLNISDANIKTKYLVCNRHFVSGKPSYYLQKNHPDWAPSLSLNKAVTYSTRLQRRVLYSYNREAMVMHTSANYRQHNKEDNINITIHSPHPFEVNENLNSSEVLLTEELLDSPMDLSTSKQSHSLVDEEPSASEQSPQLVSDLQKEIEKLTSQLEKMNADYISLKKEFAMHLERPITSNFFNKCRNSDKWMRVYTSLSTAKSFEILFKAIQCGIQEHNNCKLCKRQQLFLTLVKLSHNPTDIDLAFRFDISESTVSRYFHSWIDCIYYKLKTHVLIWPLLSELHVAMPMCFRRHYPNTVSIMDCFETQIQIPHDRNDQAATYSTYKSRNTVKYLISATPNGTINFISKGYAGRKSDQFIVRHSGYIENLKPGDEVLADKGFEVAEEIGLRGAKLTTPAFKRAAQLTQLETEISRQVSNVRIHIEREIGCMRMKFDIMRGPVIMSNLNTFQENVCFYDKIVAVCCILSNLNPSIIPFE